MRKLTFALMGILLLQCLIVIACSPSSSPAPGPTGVPAAVQFSVADLPPSNPNTQLSCPHDAPTQLDVKVDDFVPDKDGWKTTIEFRPTSINITRYVVFYTRRGDVEKSFSIDGRPSVTVYLPTGIYTFQASGSCGGSTVGFLRSAPVLRGAGEGSLNGPPDPPKPACETVGTSEGCTGK